MVEAIVFDCFGVLATDGWLPFREKHFGDKPELQQEVTDLQRRVDAGLADYQDFVQTLAKLSEISVADVRYAIENNQPNEPLFALIRELKPMYKIGFLSNAGADWLTSIFSDEQIALFDAFSLSFQTGFVKPDPRAFNDIADKLGIEPEHCILVDDQARYESGTREVGMQLVVYQDFDQAKTDLQALLAADPKD